MFALTRRIAAMAVAAPLALPLAVQPVQAETDISVFTQNQYLGADIAPLLRATDPAGFNEALVTALQGVAASEFPRRAEQLAEQIASRRPHLVALQEVWFFHCVDLGPATAGAGCSEPSIAGAFNDHLSKTLTAISAAGETYHAIAMVENLDLRDIAVGDLPAGVPFTINGAPALLIALDRDVVLARGDLVKAGGVAPAAIPCARPSAQGCNYQVFLEAETPVGAKLKVERGFVAVDATIDDKDYRFVNTHLEVYQPDPTSPLSRVFQAAQAGELIQTLAYTTPPGRLLVVAGDINSSPNHAGLPGPLELPAPFNAGIFTPYMQFTYAGYIDVWAAKPDAGDGFTCCQWSDLSNNASVLDERIDMIFSGAPVLAVKDAELVAAGGRHKTSPPGPVLWPSDHASVMAEILY